MSNYSESNYSEDNDMNYNYDDHDAFYDEDSASYHPDADHEIASHFDEEEEENEEWSDDYDDSMDGDHESGLASAGHGTDEDYGYYGDIDEFHNYYGEDY